MKTADTITSRLDARMTAACAAAEKAAERWSSAHAAGCHYSRTYTHAEQARRAYIAKAARDALRNAERPQEDTETARPARIKDPAQDARRAAADRARAAAHAAAEQARRDAETARQDARRAEKAQAMKRHAADAITAAYAARALDTTAARAAWEILPQDGASDLIRAAFGYIMSRPDLYPLPADAAENISADDILGPSWIGTVEALDKLDILPEEDPRRAWPLIRIIIGATRAAIIKTHRAERKHPGKGWTKVVDAGPDGQREEKWISSAGAVYTDALPDAETRAALIDTAARATGKAPILPEAAYIDAETVDAILARYAPEPLNAAILCETASGYTAAEIAARHGLRPEAVLMRMSRLRERARAITERAKAE